MFSISQLDMFGAPVHARLFYGLCDKCDFGWDELIERYAWSADDLDATCPECGEPIPWYGKSDYLYLTEIVAMWGKDVSE